MQNTPWWQEKKTTTKKPIVRKRQWEAIEQRALFRWAAYEPIVRDHIMHIPNGGSRKNAIEGKNLRRAGVKAGVPDIFLAYPLGGYAGLWIELKAPKDRKSIITEMQAVWHTRLMRAGYAVKVSYGWREAQEVIKNYMVSTRTTL